MGSSQSFISSEAAITTAFVAGALVVAYTQFGSKPTPATLTSTGLGKKGKKKQSNTPSESDKINSVTASTSQESLAPKPPSVPGQFEPTSALPVLSDEEPAPK